MTLKPLVLAALMKKIFFDSFEVAETIFPGGLNLTHDIGLFLNRRIYFKILNCLTFVKSTTLITPSLLPKNIS